MTWTSAYGHHARVFDIQFDPAGARFATASEDCTARVWGTGVDGKSCWSQLACLPGHGAEVLRVAWNYEGSVVSTGCADTKVRLWDVRDDYASECVLTLQPELEELYCCEWWQGGPTSLMFTVSSNFVDLWDVTKGSRLSRIEMERVATADGTPDLWKDVAAFGLAQDVRGQRAASACSDGTVRVFSLDHGSASVRPCQTLRVADDLGDPTMCMACAFSPDAAKLAVVCLSGALVVFDVRTWQTEQVLNVGRGALSISWIEHDGERWIAVTTRCSVLLVHAITGASVELESRSPQHRLLCHSYSTCTKRLVAAGEVVETIDAPVNVAAGQADGHAAPDRAASQSSDCSSPGEQSAKGFLAQVDAPGDVDPMFQDTLTVGPRQRGSRRPVGRPVLPEAAESFEGRCPIDVWDITSTSLKARNPPSVSWRSLDS